MEHVQNVFIKLSIQCSLAAEMCFFAYIKNAGCIDLLVLYLINGSTLRGGPHYSCI